MPNITKTLNSTYVTGSVRNNLEFNKAIQEVYSVAALNSSIQKEETMLEYFSLSGKGTS
jgi:hypothetical protein